MWPSPSASPVSNCGGLVQSDDSLVVYSVFFVAAPGAKRTGTKTQDLQMIPKLGLGERQHGRRKEHRFVIRVRNKQTDPLVIKAREIARKRRRRGRRHCPEDEDRGNGDA